MVAVHDAGGNGNTFAALLDALEGQQSPMAFDLPAHGRSGELDSLPDIPAMAAHTKAVLDRLETSSPVLVGNGMGAAIALQLAATDPSAVGGLVLTGGASADPQIAPDVIASLAQIVAGRARREFDRSGYSPDTDRAVYQQAFGEWVKTDPRATVVDRRAQAAWSITDQLGEITCPTLVVIGEHEEDEHRAAATALADALPNGSAVDLPGAGRHGIIETPEALADLISQFVTSSVGGAR